MDKKTFTIVLAVVLIGAFFLPYYKFNGVGTSGFDYIQMPYGGWEKYIMMLIPISGLLLLIGAVNSGNYAPARTILAWLPLLTVIYLVVRPITDGAKIEDVAKASSFGLWITLAASLALAFYNPKK